MAMNIPPGVKNWEIDKGGWRYDENNDAYYLNWDQLVEYEETSDTIENDGDFFDWFAKFRDKHGIKRAGSHSWGKGGGGGWGGSWGKSSGSSWSSSWDDDGWDTGPKKKGWLSSWWAKDVHKGFGVYGRSGDTEKLAMGMRAIRSVIRVVDDTNPPMTVEWSTGSESYTSFGDKKIVVNPKPITGHKLDDGDAIDVCTGFALHEASHSQYSREPYETLTKPDKVRPLQIGGVLLNIVEDSRIEAATVDVYPGFAPYFERTLAWVWEEMKKSGHLPKAYGPDLQSKMNTVTLACRWPKEAAATLTDPSFPAELKWWGEWRDDYLAKRTTARQAVERGIEHLRLDPKTSEELDKMAANEDAMEKAMGSLKKLIDQLIKEGMEKFGGGMTCTGKDHDDTGVDPNANRQVNELIEEELVSYTPTVPAPSSYRAEKPWITRPKEDARSKRSFIGKPSGILSRLKAALVFRQELPRYTNRLLKHGGLDEEEVWRWAARDYRVFNEEVIATRPKVQLGLLVDLSGSMTYGNKLRSAQELAQLIVMAAKDMDGVTPKVFGHTGDNGRRGCDIYRIWEPGDPVSRLGLVTSLPHGNNYDGFAIEYCISDLINRGDEDEQRVLIVLSDGYPAGDGYGGSSAETHIRAVVEWGKKQGVDVIQIAIDEDVRPDAQGRMFRHFIQFETMEALPSKLQKLLAKII